MLNVFREFKEFAIKGNMVDMAVGIVIGVAFSTIISSLVDDVIMPPFGLLVGSVDFSDMFIVMKEGTSVGPYATVEGAREAGAVTLNYGLFINAIISFLIVSFALFFVVRGINRLRGRREEPPSVPTTKECPLCFSVIPIKATRCAHCTSELQVG